MTHSSIAKNRATESKNINVHALIVAAGKGSRFGSHIAKQYTPVNITIDSARGSSIITTTKTVLEHSVSALAQSAYIHELHLVIAADDKKASTLDFDIPVRLSIGGAERWQSVKAGVRAISDSGANKEDLVLIHDAARPCVQVEHINKVIETAFNEQYGAILGVPVADTLKKVVTENNVVASESIYTIEKTIDRSELWQAQTPQVFRLGKLQQVLQYVEDNGLMITDEASAFEQLNYRIRIVKGSQQNLKLTYPEDLMLIETILATRSR